MAHIGIAGAGLLGRLLAWRLAHLGHQVEVYDPATSSEPLRQGQGAAAWTAAGMLSPLAELEHAPPDIAELGWHSLSLWQDYVQRLPAQPFFARQGSLLLAHPSDRGSAERVLNRIHKHATRYTDTRSAPRLLSPPELHELEPTIQPTMQAWWLPGEGQIDPIQTLQALYQDTPQVAWHWQQRVTDVAPGCLQSQSTARLTGALDQPSTHHTFDWVCDVRGVGGRPACAVRGVRGELIWLHAPGLALQRPLRLLHPRHRVYMVPRPDDIVVVGASEIESEDRSSVSVRTAVELLAAAHSVIPELAEARIVHLETNLRPALPDHLPHVYHEKGLLRINGLFRHGWLIAPALVEEAIKRATLLPATAS